MEPTSNLLKALINISKSKNLDLDSTEYESFDSIRIQAVGAGLELFVKDSFCGIPGIIKEERKAKYSKVFSYHGPKNNPPDCMIRNSDAIEIKKHEGMGSPELQLNSSYPRSNLFHDDRKITAECKTAENQPWKKNYLYAIGNHVKGNSKLRQISFCYGNCYLADQDVYLKLMNVISESLEKLEKDGMTLGESKELARINDIDPLKLAQMRIRGMWIIPSPKKVFEDIININTNDELLIIAIMKKEKFELFSKEDRDSLSKNSFQVKEFKAKYPNDPKKEIDLVLAKYSR